MAGTIPLPYLFYGILIWISKPYFFLFLLIFRHFSFFWSILNRTPKGELSLFEGITDQLITPIPEGSETQKLGIQCLWESHDLEDVMEWIRLLPSASVPSEAKDSLQLVDSRYVLSVPWSETRLRNVQTAHQEGKDLPPCHLVPLLFPGLPTIYSVIDGSHRSYVARTLGKPLLCKLAPKSLKYEISDFRIEQGCLVLPDQPKIPITHEQYLFFWRLGILDKSSKVAKLLKSLWG